MAARGGAGEGEVARSTYFEYPQYADYRQMDESRLEEKQLSDVPESDEELPVQAVVRSKSEEEKKEKEKVEEKKEEVKEEAKEAKEETKETEEPVEAREMKCGGMERM